MKAAERHLKIREILSSAEFVDSATLRAWLKASEATVRRDLESLEAQGILRRVHGGAVSRAAARRPAGLRLAARPLR